MICSSSKVRIAWRGKMRIRGGGGERSEPPLPRSAGAHLLLRLRFLWPQNYCAFPAPKGAAKLAHKQPDSNAQITFRPMRKRGMRMRIFTQACRGGYYFH
jgi:hypothetical protein